MKIFRPKNLFIIGITQYLLQYFVVIPAFSEANFSPSLSHWQFFWLVVDTLLIAAGGYVINDLIDLETDKINRPERKTIGVHLSQKKAVGLYVIINLIGLEIAWIIAGQVGNRMLMLIYPTAVFLLYLYSKKLKSTPLVGNLIVAIFCAGVAGIVLFAERNIYSLIAENNPEIFSKISWVFGGYILFAFLTTLIREIIKDIEDIEGDEEMKLNTLPIAFGISTAKKWATAFVFSTLFFASIFTYWLLQNQLLLAILFLTAFIFAPLIYVVIKIKEANSKNEYSDISKWIKYIMLSGLILLIIL